MVKIKLVPRNLMSLISRKDSNYNVTPFPPPRYLSPLIVSVRGLKGWEKGVEKGEERITHNVSKHWLQVALKHLVGF
jgi:hypothetical protein